MANASIPPGFNTAIPAEIMTPDNVDSRIGPLTFTDGLPSPETTQLVYDHLDFMRGVEVFLNCVPAASMEAIWRGLQGIGITSSHQVMLANNLMDSNMLFLTGNTDTVYGIALFDLEQDGPTVVEIPPGMGPGTVNDAWFRFVVDTGAPGPDRGQGGKYLILPAGYDGAVPDGYFTATSPSNRNCLILRAFLVDGKPDAANALYREGLKIYPLSAIEQPPAMEFIDASDLSFNTIHANNSGFYGEVAEVIAREPVDVIDPETRGLLAAIGIRKDRPFAPDQRMSDILRQAAEVGNATARALVFRPRDPDAKIFPDREWTTGFIGGDYRWLIDDGVGGRNLDARTMFFYAATVNTPAMVLKIPGVGSQYALAMKDRDANYLFGDKIYRLSLPADVPAKNFWSVVVYDPQTRSELQTSNPFPSVNNMRDALEYNDDGSIDLLFGPEPPSANQSNWIQTVPGKGWFAILRLYGPLQEWFDQTWKPGDIELV